MVETPDGTTARTRDTASVAPADWTSMPREERPALRSTCVRYADSPDRRTIHPPGLTGIERMETWLSADDSAFVDLLDWR